MVCQELALDPDQRVVSQPPCMTVDISQFDPAQQCVGEINFHFQNIAAILLQLRLTYIYS